MAMKIPKPPKLSRDPKIRQRYQPQIKLLLKSQIVGYSAIVIGLIIIALCLFSILNVY